MAIAILIVAGLSILVLVLESHFSGSDVKPLNNHIVGNESGENDVCFGPSVASQKGDTTSHKYVISQECRPCTRLELKMNAENCNPTGYREKWTCKVGNTEKNRYKSCPKVSWVEEKNFWIFEGVSFGIGIVSYIVAYIRQRRLDHLLMEKVHRQIASGV